jgi:hypothetical protein
MGVKTIWIIDPHKRSGRMSVGDQWVEANRLEVPGTELFVNLYDVFNQIHSRN